MDGTPSPYVTRWLLRFGYDGEGFLGWARQPGHPTIEGALRDGLRRSSLVKTLESTELEVASRTDAGVSARANALAIRSRLPAPALVRGMNGLSPSIFFTGARAISEDFRVRDALWREYRYYLAVDRGRARSLARIAEELPASLDVRTFGRSIPSERPVFRDLHFLRAHPERGGVRIDIRARSFVWGMVRKIVAALLECEAGRLPVADLRSAARGERRLTLPLAPADGLLLWEVRYAGRWGVPFPRRTRDQEDHLNEVCRRANVRLRIARAW